MENQTTLLIVAAVIVVLLVAGLVALLAGRKRRSRQLADRFGPEYDRTVETVGKRTRAEKELEERAKRVDTYHVRPLNDQERERYGDLWRRAQARFVDSPVAAVADADQLVIEVMRVRGYPMADFDQRAADLSVSYPVVVDNYRAAHSLAEKSHRGQASTEDLRQAMVHYRALFEELLEVPQMELVSH